MTLKMKPFENIMESSSFESIMGKGENAGNQHFLLFPQCFLPFPTQITNVPSHLICCLKILSNWTGKKFFHLVKMLGD